MFPLFGILHRMIFWELVRVFLLTLTGLTGLFMIGLVVQQATQMGLSPLQTIAIIPLLIPTTLPYTIPSTTLFASCVVYGRISADNEAVAMKAAGVDLLTVLRPAVLLGMLTTATTAGMYYSVIPRTQTMLQQQILQDPEEVLYNLLKRERCFRASNFPYVIYVRDVQGKRLLDVVMKRKEVIGSQEGVPLYGVEYDFVARAQEARLTVDLEKGTLALDPNRWTIWSSPQNRASGGGSKPTAGDGGQNEKTQNVYMMSEGGAKPIEVPLPDSFTTKNLKAKPTSLEWEELPARIGELATLRDDLIVRREANRQRADAEPNPAVRELMVVQDFHFAAQVEEQNRQIRVVQFEQQMRPALAVGCLCFALVGCPVGIWANRSDYLSTFVTCFMPTVFVYYPLLLAGGGLGRDGKVPMAVGVWAANAAVGLLAVALTRWLIRR